MTTTIRHRCGHSTTYWAGDRGGYVYIVTDRTPGTLGQQPTLHGGHTLTALRQAALRHQRQQRRGNHMPCLECMNVALGCAL